MSGDPNIRHKYLGRGAALRTASVLRDNISRNMNHFFKSGCGGVVYALHTRISSAYI